MLEEYAGKYITQVAYLEGGGDDFAGNYSVNIWVMLYQDGSVQGPAFVMEDMGDPNSRWVGIPDYGMWLDVNQAQGGSGYSFILWAFADEYDLIGETENNVNVFPNPTQNQVNVVAPGMNHESGNIVKRINVVR